MSKARFNHTIGALVITAVVLVATILLNVVVSLMSDKLPGMSIDLTSKGAFQLSETSIKLAQNVKKDLKITFLDDKQSYRSKASSNTYYAQVMAIAEEYGKYNNKISAEYVSIVDNPNLEINIRRKLLVQIILLFLVAISIVYSTNTIFLMLRAITAHTVILPHQRLRRLLMVLFFR